MVVGKSDDFFATEDDVDLYMRLQAQQAYSAALIQHLAVNPSDSYVDPSTGRYLQDQDHYLAYPSSILQETSAAPASATFPTPTPTRDSSPHENAYASTGFNLDNLVQPPFDVALPYDIEAESSDPTQLSLAYYSGVPGMYSQSIKEEEDSDPYASGMYGIPIHHQISRSNSSKAAPKRKYKRSSTIPTSTEDQASPAASTSPPSTQVGMVSGMIGTQSSQDHYHHPPSIMKSSSGVSSIDLDRYSPYALSRNDSITSTSTAAGGDFERKRRNQVKVACIHCKKACKKCDECRPCTRCVRIGLGDSCYDAPRKERKRGFKRGPYNKRRDSMDSNGEWSPVDTASELDSGHYLEARYNSRDRLDVPQQLDERYSHRYSEHHRHRHHQYMDEYKDSHGGSEEDNGNSNNGGTGVSSSGSTSSQAAGGQPEEYDTNQGYVESYHEDMDPSAPATAFAASGYYYPEQSASGIENLVPQYVSPMSIFQPQSAQSIVM